MRQTIFNHQAAATAMPGPAKTFRQRRLSKTAGRVASVFALGFAATTAHAVLINVAGPDVPLSGTTVAVRPELAGTVVYDNLIPFAVSSGGKTLKGQLQDRVVKEKAGNLTFYHRIILDPATNVTVMNERWQNYANSSAVYTTDVDWRKDGLGTIPALHSYRPNTTDVYIGFPHPSPTDAGMTGGTQSRFHFVRTNAYYYDVKGQTLLFGYDLGGASLSVTLPTAEPILKPISGPPNK